MRGLYAPPRRNWAPASLTVRAASSSTSRDSTVHGPAIVAKCSPPIRRPSISRTVRCSRRYWSEASLYGLRIGTRWSTPGAPSSPRLATCSRSPIAPITVTSSPAEMWACAPTDSTRLTTASISASTPPLSSRSSSVPKASQSWMLVLAICGAASKDALRLAKSRVPAVRELTRRGQASHCEMVVPGSEQLVQRREEAVVLVTRAVGDPHPALLAERPARAHDHAEPARGRPRPRPRRGRRATPRRSSPGCRWSRGRAPRARSPRACARSRSARRGAPPRPVVERLGRGRLREGVDGERLAHAIHGEAELLRAERVAHAQAAEAVDLREGAQQRSGWGASSAARATRPGPGARRTRRTPRRGSPPRARGRL